MSITILEVLQNAEYNLNTTSLPFQKEVGVEQLHNAVILLEKGYSIDSCFDSVMKNYDSVEDVPYANE